MVHLILCWEILLQSVHTASWWLKLVSSGRYFVWLLHTLWTWFVNIYQSKNCWKKAQKI